MNERPGLFRSTSTALGTLALALAVSLLAAGMMIGAALLALWIF